MTSNRKLWGQKLWEAGKLWGHPLAVSGQVAERLPDAGHHLFYGQPPDNAPGFSLVVLLRCEAHQSPIRI